MNYKYELLPIAIGTALLAGCATEPAYDPENIVDVRVLGLNDFHGVLQASQWRYPCAYRYGSKIM
ncbi:hypothetical protein [Xenorhabdus eapokensis]|uniref:Bifunctional metallophosphatase/5'-nucleotidase n=1 Tax=Xenorhabdus eapokensis TaxID=1873482 RepID=A0A1Q5TVY1_9GAMM|nr:hypothetical protein [Xenorhabdus eapokensis]OKP04343.1 bifunctional metallophosphatase/5'-nucleotidase [Xenorhabdus eapokensis]